MNESKFNKFKPDTGAEFYDEENAGNKVYSTKNNRKHENKHENMNTKYNKNFINKEESPENRFPPTNNLHNNGMNFLPHITFYRNQENENKKGKNIFH